MTVVVSDPDHILVNTHISESSVFTLDREELWIYCLSLFNCIFTKCIFIYFCLDCKPS